MFAIDAKKLTIVNFFLLIFFGFYLVYMSLTEPKTVTVDSQKLFDGFVMTKEMKRVGAKAFAKKKSVLDSVYLKLQSNALAEEEKEALSRQLMEGNQELEYLNQDYASQESLKIWARIQSYTAEFSKDKKYAVVIASQNGSNILYAGEEMDATQELLEYLNKRYEGMQ